ncbi:MAG: hypothetical protein HC828_04985 [Blastochloris sp.]|nr:hypothetical protein [Blastochloris sp.]
MWRNDRRAIHWELADLDSPNWSAEQRRQHAPAEPRLAAGLHRTWGNTM